MLYLVDLLKLVYQGQSRNKEDVNLNGELIAQEVHSFGLVLFCIKDVEVDVSEVHDEQI